MSSSPLVLIVEDLEIWQDVLREVLIDAGYRVCIAPTYSSAMQALAENSFDLAVIDPVLDDAKAASPKRSRSATPRNSSRTASSSPTTGS